VCVLVEGVAKSAMHVRESALLLLLRLDPGATELKFGPISELTLFTPTCAPSSPQPFLPHLQLDIFFLQLQVNRQIPLRQLAVAARRPMDVSAISVDSNLTSSTSCRLQRSLSDHRLEHGIRANANQILLQSRNFRFLTN
jgi:hypothetical protein